MKLRKVRSTEDWCYLMADNAERLAKSRGEENFEYFVNEAKFYRNEARKAKKVNFVKRDS